VTNWIERETPLACARVEFGGVSREVNMQCVPEAEVGDYVLVHAGIAIGRVEPHEAQRVLSLLDELALGEKLPSALTRPKSGT
jgi:hydrogenase expression/formation protein HypC